MAKSIDARAQALAENQEAVIGQQLAENYSDIVAAAAGAFHGINNMTVLNGADGVTEALSTLIGNAGAGIATVRQLLAAPPQSTANGSADREAAPKRVRAKAAAVSEDKHGGAAE